MRTIIFLFAMLILQSCKESKQHMPEAQNEDVGEVRFSESYRPQFHFSPPEKWMNDPNGLIYHNGTYHLFYQYYPEDIVWGPMHWGHATSPDMINWTHKPIALFPDEHGYIFSGSAVMDTQNTSGLGSTENPAMIAIFTYHDPDGEKAGRNDFQTQGIAYSLDEGDTWTMYDGNPVIPNPTSIRDFRDPKVFWHEATQKWIMLLVAGDHLKIYNSSNLKEWEYLSEFGKNQGAHGGVWECPDLFPLKTNGDGEEKWVLFISINPGAPNGGSGTQYFVGDFDGKTFTSPQEEDKWVDWGADNYAGVTYNGLSDENRTFIGWMSNWNYAQITPTEVWRSAMTLPRKLSLHKNTDYYLKSKPVEPELSQENVLKNVPVTSGTSIEMPFLMQSKLEFQLDKPLQDFSLTLKNSLDERLIIGYSEEKNQFYVDRMQSGKIDFEPRFAESIHTAPAILDGDEGASFSLYIDASSVELFVDEGATVMTEQVFPTEAYNELIFEGAMSFQNVHFSKVKRIWDK